MWYKRPLERMIKKKNLRILDVIDKPMLSIPLAYLPGNMNFFTQNRLNLFQFIKFNLFCFLEFPDCERCKIECKTQQQGYINYSKFSHHLLLLISWCQFLENKYTIQQF